MTHWTDGKWIAVKGDGEWVVYAVDPYDLLLGEMGRKDAEGQRTVNFYLWPKELRDFLNADD